ncbi:MAG: nucleotidyltransferase domain-containing protein [Anaerolineae bacterium]
MKHFYDRYVNGNNVSLAAYWRFPWFPAQPPPCSNSRNREANGPGAEIRFEAGAEFAIDDELPTVVSILLHGSRASRETAPFSDVDIAVILDDSRPFAPMTVKNDILALRRLGRAMYRVDPLLHHGLMFANASDFLSYDQTFLPLDTLAEARCLSGARALEVRLSPQIPLARCRQRLDRTLSSLGSYDFSLRRAQQDFTLKAFLAGLLLVPALFLAANGIFTHKRESFEWVYTGFPEVDWEAVKVAEALRRAWRAPALHPVHALALSMFSGKAQSLARFFYRENYRRHQDALPHLQELVGRMKLSLESSANAD